MTAYVHVERFRIGAQQMIVNRGDIDAAVEQLCHDRIDLGLEQHEVAHHHGAAVSRLECDPAA